MNKMLQSGLNTRIRPMEPRDFAFIQSLAAVVPTFTVPSEYILWFFLHYHSDYCRVLESDTGSATGYLISMPTSSPNAGIAIWQAAAATPSRGLALEYFAAYLHDLAKRTGATSIFFTTTKEPGTLRLIRSLARQFFECDVAQMDCVPSGQGEFEFKLSTGRSFHQIGAEKKRRVAG